VVDGLALGLVLTALGLGFRHGLDWDHLAALTDLTSTPVSRRRSMLLATTYALGHALVVFVLGLIAIVLSARLPAWVDPAMERMVGATLVLLGVTVAVSLVRGGRNFRLRSRWMVLFAAVRSVRGWIEGRRARDPVVVTHEHDHVHDRTHGQQHDHGHEHGHGHGHEVALAGAPPAVVTAHRHVHAHVGSLPDDPFAPYRPRTAFALGLLHGVGAETPTQVLVLLAAAHTGGTASGVVLLVCFVTGLVAANTCVATTATFGFVHASRNFTVYAAVSVVTAVFSLIVGSLFLLGHASLLPGLAG
jgi:high-affinity nickel-transport protein